MTKLRRDTRWPRGIAAFEVMTSRVLVGCGRATEQCDELAAFHSIISSARASTLAGSSRPSARFLPSEDAVDIAGCAPGLVGHIGPIGDQATVGDEGA